ncbi:MAG: hypothetical protein ACRDI1_04355 [Actinomycetota bacterium]
MKRAVVVLIVLLLLGAFLPVGMGMSTMGDCPACAPSGPMAALGLCLAVLATVVAVAAGPLAARLDARSWQIRLLWLAPRIDRPPWLV